MPRCGASLSRWLGSLCRVTIAAVILAAGAGTRFDPEGRLGPPGAKLLARAGGRPLLSLAIAPAMQAGLDEVVVVGGATSVGGIVPAGATLLDNPNWAAGQATSLQAAVTWCDHRRHSAMVVSLGDVPGLTASAWRAVAFAPGGPIVFARYAGRRGHPVRLDAAVWPLLPETGDEGARSLAARRPELVSEIMTDGEPDDVDTLEDLKRWT